MEEKIVYYTKGQIGKKYKVPLSKIKAWRRELSKLFGYEKVDIYIEGEIYGRRGIPEELVNIFPRIPTEKEFQLIYEKHQKIIKESIERKTSYAIRVKT